MVGWGGGGMYVSDQKGEGYFAVVTPYFTHLYVNCHHFILSYVTGSRPCHLSQSFGLTGHLIHVFLGTKDFISISSAYFAETY